MHVVCPDRCECLSAAEGSVCRNSSAAVSEPPEARKSAPVDTQHMFHSHFCLISACTGHAAKTLMHGMHIFFISLVLTKA